MATSFVEAQPTRSNGTCKVSEKNIMDNSKALCPLVKPDSPTPTCETATFGSGWFWGPDVAYAKLPGVIRTYVGYSGGKSEWPTYRSIGDHTEVVQIVFDPTKISYDTLLNRHWNNHNPYHRNKNQYMSGIWCQPGTDQMEKVKASIQKLEDPNVATKVDMLGPFYLAEGYHQKFSNRALLGHINDWLLAKGMKN